MIIDIKNTCKDFNSYRAARVKSLFNASSGSVFELHANIPIEEVQDWHIGLIVGASGTGKTSIGNKLFGGGKVVDLYGGWGGKPIIDEIGPGEDFDAVTGALANVGLGDVPSWLRPFAALSNGQQFRAGLARVIIGKSKQIIIDEFTSVVDRQIAKIGAMAFAKGWRRSDGGQVVLLSCHYDIIEWLQPDWLYDTSTGEFKKKAQLGPDQNSSLKLGRLIPLTGNILNTIII